MDSILTQAKIKQIRSLATKKGRTESGLFIVEGEKMVSEALSSDYQVVDIFRKEDIGPEKMSRISALDTPSPVLATVRIPQWNVSGLDWGAPAMESKLYLALDDVRDPGNLGTILRIADWFGVECIFASMTTVDAFNPKVVQASMGAIFRKKVIYCDLPSLCREFKSRGMNVYGTFLDGSNIYERPIAPTGLIVMGNESNGVSPSVEVEVSDRLYIPSYASGPTAESLNVAIATAVTVAEFQRRAAIKDFEERL